MNSKLKANHLVIYFDEQLDQGDDLGWCVESSDSEMTVRFGTLAGALAYAQTEEKWLRGSREKSVFTGMADFFAGKHEVR